MKCYAAVLFILASAFADDTSGGHGTSVCVEFRPSPHDRPTKVCGPIVHGGAPQRQKSAEPLMFNLPPSQHMTSDESREAEQPCDPKEKRPSQFFLPRMELAPPLEGMVPLPPMMPMELEAGAWRQSGQPCGHPQRSTQPQVVPYPAQMMAQQRPPMPSSRTWGVSPQQAMMQRAAEEQMRMSMAMRAAEEAKPGQNRKESLENLLKECEEKTKLLQEKEAKITELKTQISNKKEAESQESITNKN